VLDEGELFVVPRGMEHRTVAEPAAYALIFVKAEAVTTGEVESAWTMTQADLER
jgi:hypothetical protein